MIDWCLCQVLLVWLQIYINELYQNGSTMAVCSSWKCNIDYWKYHSGEFRKQNLSNSSAEYRENCAKILFEISRLFKSRCQCDQVESNLLSSLQLLVPSRADHVIIQNYDEQIDNHRLYVAIFIKDPYRRTIALTNEQFFLALKRYRQEIYQDIQHYVWSINLSDSPRKFPSI